MECVARCRPPCPSPPPLPRQPQGSLRSLGPVQELRRGLKLPPDVTQSSAMFTRAPASPVRRTASAVGDFYVIAAASPAKSGDVTVFLQTRWVDAQ